MTYSFVDKEVSTVTVHRIFITEGMLREKFNIPDDAEIKVDIPGGGDYSNMSMSIADLKYITVQWKTYTVSPKETHVILD